MKVIIDDEFNPKLAKVFLKESEVYTEDAALIPSKVIKTLISKLGLVLLDAKYDDGEKEYVLGKKANLNGRDIYIPIFAEYDKYYRKSITVGGRFTTYEYFLRLLGIPFNRFGVEKEFKINSMEDLKNILPDINDVINKNRDYLLSKLNQVKDEEDLDQIIKIAEEDPLGWKHVLNLDDSGNPESGVSGYNGPDLKGTTDSGRELINKLKNW